MPTLVLNPSGELNLVTDQNRVFPATPCIITDENNLPVDLTNGWHSKLTIREYLGGPVILEWNSDDDTITFTGDDGNIATFTERTAEEMNIDAKRYLLNWTFTPEGGQPFDLAKGVLIIDPT